MKLTNYLCLNIFSLIGITFFMFLLIVLITQIFPNKLIYFSLNAVAITFFYLMLINIFLILLFIIEIFIKKMINFSIKIPPMLFYFGFIANIFFILIYFLLINS